MGKKTALEPVIRQHPMIQLLRSGYGAAAWLQIVHALMLKPRTASRNCAACSSNSMERLQMLSCPMRLCGFEDAARVRSIPRRRTALATANNGVPCLCRAPSPNFIFCTVIRVFQFPYATMLSIAARAAASTASGQSLSLSSNVLPNVAPNVVLQEWMSYGMFFVQGSWSFSARALPALGTMKELPMTAMAGFLTW
eukprot:CAMPEP_0179237380 /NCGR_PEP_ID=MMETSP0797-20121207/14409_1 /TAXON_ID=47934 /ORGANISM="Dinophysis acuminata, Strain DAEP01" /LENGTH=195 /DNA_ID=CAMNT_0020944657 /DNA_START=351 /DNA_END=935 /DNA_ORIENTATION=+